MAISYVGVGTAATSAGGATGSVTPTLPSGLATNDLMIIIVTGRGNHSFAIPTGWTQKFQEQLYPTDNLHKLAIFYKFYAAGDGNPTVSWTGGGTNQTVIAQVFAFRGVDTTNPIPDLGPNSGNASAQNIGPITGFTPTGAGNDGCVIVIGHKADDWTSVAVLTGDGLTWNEIAEPDTTSGSDAGQVYDYALYSGSPPTITNKTFTVTGGAANTGAGKMISLKAKTAVTIEIELFEPAISFSDALTREASRPLSEPAVSIPEESLVRAVQRALTEASISIPAETLTRLVERVLSEPALSFTDAVEKSVQRNISLEEATISILAESLVREVERILSEPAIAISGESVARNINRILVEPSLSMSDAVAVETNRVLAEPSLSFIDSIQIEIIPGAPAPLKPEEFRRCRRWRWPPPIAQSYSIEFPLIGWAAKPYELTHPLTIEVARTYELSLLLQGDVANRFERSYPLSALISKPYRVVLDLSGTVARTHEAMVQLSGLVARRYEKLLTLRGEVRRSYQAEFELIGVVQDAFTQYALYKAILDLIEEDEDQ